MGNNIQVPYSGYIEGGVHDGTDVVISGRTSHSFNSFSLNLCTGPNIDGDTVLHFNPRFNQGNVVRNHKQGGNWGSEETSGGMPFRRGHTFTVHMKVQHSMFRITVNNRHFTDFHYRLPKESIRYLYIEGDVVIDFIQFRGTPTTHGGHHPPPFPQPGYPPAPAYPPTPAYPPAPAYPPTPGYPPAPAPGPAPGGPIFNPPVPFTTSIPGGLYPGKIIYITGAPFPSCSRFSVNLMCGPYESSDWALHFDARVNYGNDNNVVIRNHKQGNNWGSEEKHQNYFPFVPGVNFEMMILVEPGCFKVAVNNQHFTEFRHRVQPFNRADHLNITGDITLSQVRFQ